MYANRHAIQFNPEDLLIARDQEECASLSLLEIGQTSGSVALEIEFLPCHIPALEDLVEKLSQVKRQLFS